MDEDFAAAVALAGYFLAHGLWSLSDGARVVPMVAHEGESGRGYQRFLGDDGITGALRAEEWLATNPHQASRAVMVVDGYAELDGVRRDALIAHVIEYGPPRRSLHIVLPYRPFASNDGFAVHSPRFGSAENLEEVDLDGLGRAFFAGVGSHSAASEIWADHLDESI